MHGLRQESAAVAEMQTGKMTTFCVISVIVARTVRQTSFSIALRVVENVAKVSAIFVGDVECAINVKMSNSTIA